MLCLKKLNPVRTLILVGTVMGAEWTRRSRSVDATVTVTLPNHKNHRINQSILVQNAYFIENR